MQLGNWTIGKSAADTGSSALFGHVPAPQVATVRTACRVGCPFPTLDRTAAIPPLATALRNKRAVVSYRIETSRGLGWPCERLWRPLERAAFKGISHASESEVHV